MTQPTGGGAREAWGRAYKLNFTYRISKVPLSLSTLSLSRIALPFSGVVIFNGLSTFLIAERSPLLLSTPPGVSRSTLSLSRFSLSRICFTLLRSRHLPLILIPSMAALHFNRRAESPSLSTPPGVSLSRKNMGKQGPCHHCGATSTPLWRNGPPEKPILCNACGSRWRTKGTLVNYTPIHAREGVDQIGVGRGKGVDQEVKRKRKEFLSLKGRRENEGEAAPAEEDTSNRSSSGSAISYSESCSHFGGEPAAAQSNAWDSLVPSRKRTCVGRPKPSHVEQLTMDLHSILHQQPSYISTSPEEELLYDSDVHYGSFEICNGGVVLRHPNPAAPDEESEASSLPAAMDSYSRISSLPVNSIGKIKTSLPPAEDNLLKSKNSPLTAVNLEKIFNPEIFLQRLTLEEQQQLKRYLPRVDATSESLLDLFRSKQFKENISSFGQLLQEGIFDLSSSAANSDECRALEKLVLRSSEKSKWVECYVQIKSSTGADRRKKGVRIGGERPEKKLDMKSPKRTNKPRVGSILSLESPSSLSYGLLEEEEEGLLLDLRPSGSFPEAELLSETWKQTSTSSSSSYPLKRLGS